MHIVAVSAEPEFLTLREVTPNSDCWDLGIELARLQVGGKTDTGSVQVTLLAADAKNVRGALCKDLFETLTTMIDERRHIASQQCELWLRRRNDVLDSSAHAAAQARVDTWRAIEKEMIELRVQVKEVIEHETR